MMNVKALIPMLIFLSTALAPPALWAEDCKYETTVSARVDVNDSESLDVIARAGTLKIQGIESGDSALVSGRVCVSDPDWLDQASLLTDDGRRARIEVQLPDTDGGWSLWGGNRYARMDLELEVPRSLHLVIRDSSGSMDLVGIGSADITDSSGSIEVEDADGPLVVQDSSGSISFDRIRGDVTIESDSSGSIRGQHIEGSVLVVRDSSGSIRFSDVAGDFTVERDSSGGIVARDIGGDFTVLKDGSGDIQSDNVRGEVRLPEG
ncbi:MAG: hypothetical protein HKN58_00695 [Xanthomonadales bacterium]|nr:hypothetical protein [Xanthomonadales bacterium]